ncbi:MAG TPA: alpha/beta hydrolase-fold protein [Longimicrobiales bacterium]|nr:alpha/beta hydrolase-fold protein [Longimicrobiales bacterium]
MSRSRADAPGSGLAASPVLVWITVAVTTAALPEAVLGQGGGEALEPVVSLLGTLQRVEVHGRSLEGNLEGDSPDRDVSVYLPPSYAVDAGRRYPVVYVLHGFTDSDLNWFGWREHFVNVPAALERALEAGRAREMILVMPDAFTVYQGSMYSSSVTTGDWETYVAEELVSWVDAHYRTVADRASRGLAGHSMGGYGTIRIGMKRPDVFSSIYVMSPCCMEPNLEPGGRGAAAAEAIRDPSQVADAAFGVKAMLASAAAWSPDPRNPPLYLDLPVRDGEVQPDVVARWVANAPLAMVHQYVFNLRKLHAIAMDAGAQDRSIADATRTLDGILTLYGIEHTAEIYDPGTHVSRVGERVEEEVLPFFSANLAFPAGR